MWCMSLSCVVSISVCYCGSVAEGEKEVEEEGQELRKGSASSKKAKPAKRKSSLSGKTKDK